MSGLTKNAEAEFLRAPLCPAGHLPLKGGDHAGRDAGIKPAALPVGADSDDGVISPLVGEMSGRTEGGAKDRGSAARAWQAAAPVVDPEIPCVTIADLGILRSVEVEGNVATAEVTPTYSGCPAVLAIELSVEAALRDAGFEPKVKRVLSPAWTTDWITAEGREKLRAFGIAPPEKASNLIRALFGETTVTCPHCGSRETKRVSEFGSTACKALYRCTACGEPFDYFKCI